MNVTEELADIESKLEMYMGSLDAREQRFVLEYMAEPCKARAARRAGYSQTCARRTGMEKSRDPRVKRVIDLCKRELTLRSNVDAQRLIRELVGIAYADIRDIRITPSGRIKSTTPHSARAVQSADIEVTETTDENGRRVRKAKAKIKMHSKQAAIRMLCDHLGLLNPKLPPLEVLLARLPEEFAGALRRLIADPTLMPTEPPTAIGDQKATIETPPVPADETEDGEFDIIR